MSRTLYLLVLVACASERQPDEPPFITCPVTEVYEAEVWVGTASDLIAPPGSFPEALAGLPLDISLVGFDDDKLYLLGGVVREDGGLHARVLAQDFDLRGLPLRVRVGSFVHVVHPPRQGIDVDVEHDPAITEKPDEYMSFAATLSEPLERGAFLSLSTGEMIELPVDELRIDVHIEGHEGHTAIVGLRTAEGETCFRTPCGCSEEVRRLGLCGPPAAPSSEPDEPI